MSQSKCWAGGRRRPVARALLAASALLLGTGAAAAQSIDATGSIGPALEVRETPADMPLFASPRQGPDDTAELDAQVRPHWCNETRKVVDEIARLGGESVMRRDYDGGRRVERYWNKTEEVTFEHGADGMSCLVDMRVRVR